MFINVEDKRQVHSEDINKYILITFGDRLEFIHVDDDIIFANIGFTYSGISGEYTSLKLAEIESLSLQKKLFCCETISQYRDVFNKFNSTLGPKLEYCHFSLAKILEITFTKNISLVYPDMINFLSRYTSHLNKTFPSGSSYLHLAIESNNIELVQALLEAGVDINIKNADQQSPLHVACNRGLTEIKDLLLANNADITLLDLDNWYPLHYAIFNGEKDIIKLIHPSFFIGDTDYSIPSILHLAASHASKKSLETLLNNGADTSRLNFIGETPLMTSVGNDNSEIFSSLLKFSNDLNIVNSDGLAILHIVLCNCDMSKFYAILKTERANVNLKLANGYTVMHLACILNNLEAVVLLDTYFCDLNVSSDVGLSPYECAYLVGASDILVYLSDPDLCCDTELNEEKLEKFKPIFNNSSLNIISILLAVNNGHTKSKPMEESPAKLLQNFSTFSPTNVKDCVDELMTVNNNISQLC
ncbi:MAG: ankyrin repeat domain-containing protein [Pseudomonadota bacterium]|nr:ankyrin repeat domain-containing protein [Pseudomonadota bacterium]